MKNLKLSMVIAGLLLFTACDRQAGSNTAAEQNAPAPKAAPQPAAYTETGDLNALRERGRLRLAAPRFDGADALPRQGIPVRDYQRIAEEFANSLGLQVQWVYVEAFTDLIPLLEAGDADLIVTNMTETRERTERVAFSRPINQVDEVIVGPREGSLNSLEGLAQTTLTVRRGSAYVETLADYNSSADAPIAFETVPASESAGDILAAVAAGEYEATVLDSNVAEQLLLDYPELKVGATLKRSRPVGWAVRQNNPQLLRSLNEFLVAHFLTSTSFRPEARDWAAIQQHGRLRMLTLNNPASYFMWRGELMGFDYDLAKKFAEQHKLHLAVVLKNSIPELIAALNNGEGDFIAASITKTPAREARGIVFSDPYLRVNEQLIGRADGPAAQAVTALAGKTVGVNPDTVFYRRLRQLQEQGIELELVEYPGVLTEELFARLNRGEFDFMVADSHLASMEQAYTDTVKVNLDLGGESEIAWVLRPEQTQLARALNTFIDEEYRGLFYNVTFNKYFVNERKIRSLHSDRVTEDSALSPYDDIVQEVAANYGLDWRLITAQMYQESRFDPKAKSFAGAQGLMQVMPRTAREFGYENLNEPRTGIEAGIAYLSWLEERFPGDIDFQERIYFQLAAYNAGAGHVRDARRLARQLDYDPNRWFGHVEQAMLLLATPEYYKKARFGYVRGSEPVTYVRSIRARYLAYLNR